MGVTGCSGLFFDRRRRSVECGSGIKYTAQHRMMEQWLLFHCYDKTLTTAAGCAVCVVIARQYIAVPCDGLARLYLMR